MKLACPARRFSFHLTGLILALVTIGCQRKDPGTTDSEYLQIPGAMTSSCSVTDLAQWYSKWDNRPDYFKLTLAEQLVAGLASQQAAEVTGGYDPKSGEHDLRRVAGRCAWALEKLLSAKLPIITPNSTTEELSKIRESGQMQLVAYRTTVLNHHKKRKERSVSDLRAAYEGRIQPGITDNAPRSASEFAKLLGEWFPVGKKLTDLEKIVGTPAKSESSKLAVYTFENGRTGTGYGFHCENGIIKLLLPFRVD